jgi:circadian clock protein KaiC
VSESTSVQKSPTGIGGFDEISDGGLPKDRVTLVSGTAGSAKTVFATQFLAAGITEFDEAGVFVTFEEPPEDIRANLLSFGWSVTDWEAQGKWAFVDASPDPEESSIIAGAYDFGALIARVESAVRKTNAKRLSMDSLSAVFASYPDPGTVRQELRKVIHALKLIGVTSVVTSERSRDYGEIARFGVEEFVADNVIVLRNKLEDEKRRRSMEVLKFRGTDHRKGEYPFTVVPERGIIAVPLSSMELKQASTDLRVTSGNDRLDEMCGGGWLRDSVVLASGATGTGKTLLVTTFLSGGAARGERTLLFAFEESRHQLFRNARGWGYDFEGLEEQGLLKVVSNYPETKGLEDHLIWMKELMDDYRPDRLAVDSLSAMERVSSVKGFREFVIGLTSFVKDHAACALFTSTTPTLLGGTSITEAHISTITDSIILLRYVELYGEMRRGLTILKMRGSNHEKDIREFTIDASGMHLREPFRSVSGILSGSFQLHRDDEVDRIEKLFHE